MSRPSRLTREQAMAIRDSYQRLGVGRATLAARYQVSSTTIHSVVKGRHCTVRDQPDIARPAGIDVRGKYSLRPPS